MLQRTGRRGSRGSQERRYRVPREEDIIFEDFVKCSCKNKYYSRHIIWNISSFIRIYNFRIFAVKTTLVKGYWLLCGNGWIIFMPAMSYGFGKGAEVLRGFQLSSRYRFTNRRIWTQILITIELWKYPIREQKWSMVVQMKSDRRNNKCSRVKSRAAPRRIRGFRVFRSLMQFSADLVSHLTELTSDCVRSEGWGIFR